MNIPGPPPSRAVPIPEEIAALALNEQGFLFQQRILEELALAPDGHWQPSAVEFPVSFGLPGTFESRIDMVLKNTRDPSGPWHLIVECKRANPDYKQWLFFDQKEHVTKTDSDGLFVQRADFTGSRDHRGQIPLTKRIHRVPAPKDCLSISKPG